MRPAAALRIATCRPLPEPDQDEDLLLEALRAAGIDAVMAGWRGGGTDWREPVPTLLRSTSSSEEGILPPTSSRPAASPGSWLYRDRPPRETGPRMTRTHRCEREKEKKMEG